jgi:hydrogenase/urease accessory protein HupE
VAALWRMLPVGVVLGWAAPSQAHPLPFSSVDLRVEAQAIEVTVTAHWSDLVRALAVMPADGRLDGPEVTARAAELVADRAADIVMLLGRRLGLAADGRPVNLQWSAPQLATGAILEDQSPRVRVRARHPIARAPARITLEASLFPHDPAHQSFVTIYRGTSQQAQVVDQFILDRGHPRLEHFAGGARGRVAMARKFVAAGIHHLLIGADHLLFLVGLLLLGGSLRQLVLVASAFTVGHSVTLSLAALQVVSPPARIIEPAIALSIVFVGADNLFSRPGARDLRPIFALVFGLIHGFGFAGVLREMGLPGRALGWSLFSFNLGVEIGQLAVVLAVSSALVALRSRSEWAGRRLAFAGSVVVAAAGAFWFIERVFFAGGIS